MSQIAKFMEPTWGPPGSCRPQMGPMLAPWTLQSGVLYIHKRFTFSSVQDIVHFRYLTVIFSKELRQDAPQLACKDGVWALFCEFTIQSFNFCPFVFCSTFFIFDQGISRTYSKKNMCSNERQYTMVILTRCGAVIMRSIFCCLFLCNYIKWLTDIQDHFVHSITIYSWIDDIFLTFDYNILMIYFLLATLQ